MLKQMFNDLNAVDSVEWLIACEIVELTQAKLKVRNVIGGSCVPYSRWVTVYPYHVAGMARQKKTNRSRPASGVKDAVVVPRECDPLYQPELCFMPEAWSCAVRPQSSGLIVSANVDRVAVPPFQPIFV